MQDRQIAYVRPYRNNAAAEPAGRLLNTALRRMTAFSALPGSHNSAKCSMRTAFRHAEDSRVKTCSTIVLAAGEGTRMRCSRPKVLHAIAGRPLIEHVLSAVEDFAEGGIAVVIGPAMDAVAKAVKTAAPEAEIFIQTERRGTGHAVLAARPALARDRRSSSRCKRRRCSARAPLHLR